MRWSSLRSRSPLPLYLYLLLVLLICLAFNFSWGQAQSSAEQEKTRRQAGLNSAAAKGQVGYAKDYVELGADVNAPLYCGVTALMEAARHENNLDMVRFLIASGANVNAKDGDGQSALMIASDRGYMDIVLALLQAGADANAEDNSAWTPLMFASSDGHTDVALALIKAGAKLNRGDNSGPSPLMLAVWGCHADTVHELMRANARLAATDWKKERAPQFDDFPAGHIYRGLPAAVNFRSNPKASTYRTRLGQAAPKGPDFAGHFTVADWGCGSSCQSQTFIDATNGAVIDGVSTERGAWYQLDSDLFIADPKNDEVAYEDDPINSAPISYYVMRKGKLSLVYEQPCTVRDNRQQCGCEDLQKLVLQPAGK